MEMATLAEFLKIGGPLLTLTVFVVYLMDRSMRQLITALTNHLTHTEGEQKETNRLLTILVERDRT